jgi:hypothetical protein
VIGSGILKTLTGGAVGVLAVARAAGGHVGWYVRHQMTGAARDEESKDP